MILATDQLTAAIANGAIDFYDPDGATPLLEGSHIDVRIGEYSWLFQPRPTQVLRLRDALPRDWFTLRHTPMEIMLPAHSFILAHTHEYLGTALGSQLLPTLHTRSTFARWGLGVHLSAGFGDEGYSTRWTLEIYNPHAMALCIPVKATVGMIVFEELRGNASSYAPGTRYNVKRAEWSPYAMLPRAGNWRLPTTF